MLLISQQHRCMDVINAAWINARLTGRHGEKAELAAHVGIDSEKLSKILRGSRKVQIEEAPRFVSYFEGEAESSERRQRLNDLLRQLSEADRRRVEDFAAALASSSPRIEHSE